MNNDKTALNIDNFIITCDSNSDINIDIVKKYSFVMMLMPYSIDDVELVREPDEDFDHEVFYASMRAGSNVKTMATNAEDFKEMWRPILEKGIDILHIGFSSGLSGTYSNALFAKEELDKEFPDRKLIMVDTLAIAFVLGQILIAAGEMKLENKSMEEIADFVESEKLHYAALVAPEDLVYLKRGGRLSAASATFGTLLNVKPIIKLASDGKLLPVTKCKGKKKMLKFMVQTIVENARNKEGDTIVVMHADAESDADALVDLLKEGGVTLPITKYIIGPVIGAHIGPGALGICFVGNRDF